MKVWDNFAYHSIFVPFWTHFLLGCTILPHLLASRPRWNNRNIFARDPIRSEVHRPTLKHVQTTPKATSTYPNKPPKKPWDDLTFFSAWATSSIALSSFDMAFYRILVHKVQQLPLLIFTKSPFSSSSEVTSDTFVRSEDWGEGTFSHDSQWA